MPRGLSIAIRWGRRHSSRDFGSPIHLGIQTLNNFGDRICAIVAETFFFGVVVACVFPRRMGGTPIPKLMVTLVRFLQAKLRSTAHLPIKSL